MSQAQWGGWASLIGAQGTNGDAGPSAECVLAVRYFGTGYSSLSYLKRFPVSRLKIDRSFVQDVAVNADDAAITTAIISMAKCQNLRVIAEGVENEAQMSFLREHHCDEIQGYYGEQCTIIGVLPSELGTVFPADVVVPFDNDKLKVVNSDLGVFGRD